MIIRRLAAAMALVAAAAPALAADLTLDDIPLPISREAARAYDPSGSAPIDDPLTCLARAVYFEARSEGEIAMRAVAHVVKNRVDLGGFPDRVCEVIKQGGESGPCQFSWWCDGRSDDAQNALLYAEAREIAREVLNGESEDPTHGATMFHNGSVSPSWSKRAKRTVQIGSHTFYRLK